MTVNECKLISKVERTLRNWAMCHSSCSAAGLPGSSAPMSSSQPMRRRQSCAAVGFFYEQLFQQIVCLVLIFVSVCSVLDTRADLARVSTSALRTHTDAQSLSVAA